MATVRENMLDMMDAAASVDTAAMMSADDTFVGNITAGDEDWVAIDLTEGNTYTITVGGNDPDGDGVVDDTLLNDSVLKLLDSKGGVIEMNDDKEGDKGDLSSEIKFTPETGSGTQTYYISVSGNSDNPGSLQTGSYTLSVMEVAVLPEGEGADIEGTSMADKLVGTANAESIAGLGGHDTLIGGAGDDTLSGGDGNDLLNGGPGADKINGGEGVDTITYNGSMMGVSINLRAGTASGGDAEGDTLGDDIENVMGSNYDDVLSGSRDNNMIWGLRGNDELFGDKGDDDLFGGAGDDTLDGGDGDDTLEGGYGADVLTGGEDDDTASYSMSMMGVTVRLHSGQADYGDAEGDTWGDMVTETYMLPDEDGEMQEHEETVPDIVNLTGSGMADILAGDSRANTIDGGGGDDKIYGGPGGGDDTLMGGGGDDMIWGGHGADTLHGGGGDDMLHGGPGADVYYGGAGSDMIYAHSDDTGTISGAAETDDDTTGDFNEMTGNAMGENDTVSYARNKTAVTVNLETDTRFVSIETVVGTSEDDTLTGSDAASETIEGGDGADMLAGGAGQSDTVSYENSDRRVNVDISGDPDTTSGGHAQGDTISGFENITGSAHDDILTGDDAANILKGLAGADEIVGGDGFDTVEGGYGADELDGDNGRTAGQTEAGRAGDGTPEQGDTLSYAGSMAAVSANLATHTYSGGDAEGDEVAVQRGDGAQTYDHDMDAETEALEVSTFEHLIGSMNDDRLTGDHRSNKIQGGDGDDTISGGGAFDVLMGQKGDDTISGGAGADHLVGGPGADRMDGGEDRGERNNTVLAPAGDGVDNDGDGTTDEEGERAPATIDWAVYREAMGGVAVDLSEGRGTGGEAMGDRLIGIELIWGSRNDDTFIASGDEDTHDIIHGDGGSDTVSYEASETGVTVNLGTAAHHTTTNVTGTGTDDDPFVFPDETDPAIGDVSAGNDADNADTNGAFGDRLGSIENLTGSDNNDMLTGDGNPNVLKGGEGNDTLVGEGSNDKLYGGAGRDILNGGVGIDKLDGGAGDDELSGGGENDTFVFAPGHGDDIINDFADGDQIDLTAFELEAEDLIPLISIRGDGADGTARAFIDLRTVGGGTIEVTDVTDLDGIFDAATETSPVDLTNNDAIDVLDMVTDDDPGATFIL